jgi:DNA-binding GntR family transcriptional regulator
VSGGGLPKYRRVANRLRQQIRSGELAPGQAIPSETQLVEQFGISHMTARNAVAALRFEGLVVARHGRGVFVADPPPGSLRAGVEAVRDRLRRGLDDGADPQTLLEAVEADLDRLLRAPDA